MASLNSWSHWIADDSLHTEMFHSVAYPRQVLRSWPWCERLCHTFSSWTATNEKTQHGHLNSGVTRGARGADRSGPRETPSMSDNEWNKNVWEFETTAKK